MSTLKAAFWPGQSHRYGCIHPKCNNNKLYCVSNGSFHLSQGTTLSRTHSPGVASKYFLQSSLLYISIQMQTRLKEKLCTRICNSLLCFCFAICCQIKTKNIRLLANWIPSSALHWWWALSWLLTGATWNYSSFGSSFHLSNFMWSCSNKMIPLVVGSNLWIHFQPNWLCFTLAQSIESPQRNSFCTKSQQESISFSQWLHFNAILS